MILAALDVPLWLRVTHWINVLFLGWLIPGFKSWARIPASTGRMGPRLAKSG